MSGQKEKSHLRATILFIGLMLALYVFWPHQHLYLSTPTGKILIPDEIVAHEDCQAYAKFIQPLAIRGYVPDTDCPWAKVGPIGEFSLGDIKLRVPREYIWLNRHQPNGPVDDLPLMFKYPDMTPGNADTLDSTNINLMLRDLGKHACANVKCIRQDAYEYQVWVFGGRSSLSEMDPDHATYDSKLKLYTFRITQKTLDGSIGDIKDVYFRGDPHEPDYWLYCDVPYEKQGVTININPGCETSFYFTKNLIAHGTFRRSWLPQHDAIRQNLLQRLQSFLVNPPDSEGDKHGNHT